MNRRIDALRKTLSDGECVFISSYPNIFYFSKFTSGDAYLIISHDKTVIITDSRYTVQAKEQCPDFEIWDISKGIAAAFDEFSENTVFYEEKDISVGFYINLKKRCTTKTFVPASDKISIFRRIKDKDEIKTIHQAEQLGDLAFEHIIKIIKPGMTEIEVATELEYFLRKNGALKLSFDTVAASGYRSSMPHGVASKKEIKNGEFLTLDFGCILDGYCSDMTRTVAVGYISEQEKEVYDIVLKAQEEALKQMKIGMKCSEIDGIARNIITKAGYGENFGHSLGHSVGIEIHEAPNFSSKSPDVFAEGNVITVEPGIYIDNHFGVRIEDVVAAVDGEIINLTSSPKELIIIN